MLSYFHNLIHFVTIDMLQKENINGAMTGTLQSGSIHVADMQDHAFSCKILQRKILMVCEILNIL
jgi:hypothetical protein